VAWRISSCVHARSFRFFKTEVYEAAMYLQCEEKDGATTLPNTVDGCETGEKMRSMLDSNEGEKLYCWEMAEVCVEGVQPQFTGRARRCSRHDTMGTVQAPVHARTRSRFHWPPNLLHSPSSSPTACPFLTRTITTPIVLHSDIYHSPPPAQRSAPYPLRD
jgi:hypothetical protein